MILTIDIDEAGRNEVTKMCGWLRGLATTGRFSFDVEERRRFLAAAGLMAQVILRPDLVPSDDPAAELATDRKVADEFRAILADDDPAETVDMIVARIGEFAAIAEARAVLPVMLLDLTIKLAVTLDPAKFVDQPGDSAEALAGDRAWLARWTEERELRLIRRHVVDGLLQCEMCGKTIEPDLDRSHEDARHEAIVKGIDPAQSGIVCDACYKLTPWGGKTESN